MGYDNSDPTVTSTTTHWAWDVHHFNSSGGWRLLDLETAGVNSGISQDHRECVCAALSEHTKVHLFRLQQESPHCSYSTSGGGVYLATDWVLHHCKLAVSSEEIHYNIPIQYRDMVLYALCIQLYFTCGLCC